MRWLQLMISETCEGGLQNCYTKECSSKDGPYELARALNNTSSTVDRILIKKELENMRCAHVKADIECDPSAGDVCQPRKPMYCCGTQNESGKKTTPPKTGG